MKEAAEKQRAAAAIQRQSVERQAEATGVRLIPWDDDQQPDIEADCDRMSEAAVAPILDRAAKAEGLDRNLLRAVIQQESGFHACAVSSAGAQGLMQLMPATAGQFAVRDPFDPAENVAAGAKYLKQLLDRYRGDLFLALSAYNAGPTAVDESGGIPPFSETLGYVGAILERLGR